jgi:ABC-type uncharacterized transport system permease subunit
VVFGVDHIVSGVALNIIGVGIAKYLASRFFNGLPGGGPTQSPPLKKIPSITVPGLSDGLGTIERKHWFFVSDFAAVLRALVTDVSALTLIAIALFVATWWILWRTAFGLRLRSVGESPSAAESLGVNVYRYKFLAVLASGALAGLGGAFLTLVASNVYRDGQTGGRGYIGLAAMIFGNWRPGGLLAGSALFGYTDAIRLRGGDSVHALLLAIAVALVLVGIWQIVRKQRAIQGGVAIVVGLLVAWWYFAVDQVPGELAGTTPYVATLLVLAFASQRSANARGRRTDLSQGRPLGDAPRGCGSGGDGGTVESTPIDWEGFASPLSRRRRGPTAHTPISRWASPASRPTAECSRDAMSRTRPTAWRCARSAAWSRRCTWAAAGSSRLSIASGATVRR